VTTLSILLALYFLPAFIASLRRKNQAGAIVALNLFLGWTLIGWVVALVMALWNDPQKSAAAQERGSAPAQPEG